mmetsp:Transcript_50560/g.83806  ORF Transcript_50560/g.83806 Transcript_50560/m.83806 type:complete len:264 (+) Transcript_50560:463-1254(+)
MSQKPSGWSASALACTERKWRPRVPTFPSSKSCASSCCSALRIRASRYWVSSPTSMRSSRLSSTALAKARSVPASHAAMAAARFEKMTSPGTMTSGLGAWGRGQREPKPMFSVVMPPPSKNSPKGSVTKAYCSPRSWSGSLTGSFTAGASGRGLLYPGISGYTSSSLLLIHSYNLYVTRLGVHLTPSSSLSAMVIMFFIWERKNRIACGLTSASSMSLCTRFLSSLEFTQLLGTASAWKNEPLESVTSSSQSFLPSAPCTGFE